MREYSVPATVRVGDEESLVDAVYDTAAEHGSAVVYRRRASRRRLVRTSPPPSSPTR